MSHLYFVESDVKVGLRSGQVVVTNLEDGSERIIPFANVDGISVFGMAQLSTRLLRECISSDVPILYYSEDGHYFGSINSPTHVNPERQKKQVILTDNPEFCLGWSKTVIDAKIRNSLTLLKPYDLGEDDIHGLTHSLENLKHAETVESVMGFEGNAAKCYFSCLSKAVLPEEMRFQGRNTRPPKDPFNSMLSFGYNILYRNMIGAIERHGLHPYFAFMHKIGLGHAALASDLVEDLRAPLVDRIVLDFVNSGEVRSEDFESNARGAVYMSRDTMRRLTVLFKQAMVKGDGYFSAYGDGKAYGFQVMLDKKIASVVEAIDKADAFAYTPFIWER